MLDRPSAAPGARGVNDRDAVEHPERGPENIATYGSDCVAGVIRALGIPYAALNPGASFRGLHDSLVNHLGNRDLNRSGFVGGSNS